MSPAPRPLPEAGRFVLLAHDHPERHLDLLLEAGVALRAWRVPWPAAAGAVPAGAVPGTADRPRVLDAPADPLARPAPDAVLALTELPDHRPQYLQYEGPVSGGRGQVRRVAAGRFRGTAAGAGRWYLVLDGGPWSGRWLLVRDHAGAWTLRAMSGPVR